MKLDNAANLASEILEGFVNRNQSSLMITETINDNISNAINKTQFAFDNPAESQIQIDMDK